MLVMNLMSCQKMTSAIKQQVANPEVVTEP